jgi:dynein heavy chain
MKNALAADAAATRKRMDAANRLINSLSDNKVRWEGQKAGFIQDKTDLIGNVAKAAAFVCYCGPFNSDFRNKLTADYFQTDLDKREVPSIKKITLTNFLVSQTQVGEWAMEGLPSDDLSIQNAIMVTKADRFPLMVDPQGQAQKWIVKREPSLTENKRLIFTLSVPDLKGALSLPIENGLPCLIKDIENDIDPLLDPVLEKQLIKKGRSFKIIIGGQEFDFDANFKLYMTSRMANPAFSPELFAKATIIDFTVTQGGLEQQLLGILIGKIEKQLEEQLSELQESVTLNNRQLKEGEEMLLYKLANAEGSLLDDPSLIDVLAEIKAKSKEV